MPNAPIGTEKPPDSTAAQTPSGPLAWSAFAKAVINTMRAVAINIKNKVKKLTRYALAVVIGVVAGEIAGIAIGALFYLIFGEEVTGGRWTFNVPNIIMVCCKGFVTGYAAGWIAKKHEKLVAVLANFFFLTVIMIVEIVKNIDYFGHLHDIHAYDTEPQLWIWISLIPAILGAHVAKKFGISALAMALGVFAGLLSFVLYAGAVAMHIWTTIIAYNTNGFFAAFLTFSLPPFSEIYWFFAAWHNERTIFNQYDCAIMAFLAICLLQFIFVIGMVKFSDDGTSE